MERSILIKYLSRLVVPFAVLLVGLIIYYSGIFNKLLFPNPIDVLIEFFKLFSKGSVFLDFSSTFIRVIISGLLSLVLGIPIGLLLGYSKRIYSMFEFSIDFLRSVPISTFFPIFMLFFGIGDLSKIALCVWATTLILIVNTSYGVKHANKAHLRLSQIYKTTKKFRFIHIIFPGALPHIFAGTRIGLSIALVLIIMYEMFVGSVSGLGHAILNAQLAYQIPHMYALILLTGIFGYLLNKLFLLIEQKVVHWT